MTKECPYSPLLTGVETLPGVVAGAARAVDAEDEEVGAHFGSPEESHPLLDLPDGELQHGQGVRETQLKENNLKIIGIKCTTFCPHHHIIPEVVHFLRQPILAFDDVSQYHVV